MPKVSFQNGLEAVHANGVDEGFVIPGDQQVEHGIRDDDVPCRSWRWRLSNADYVVAPEGLLEEAARLLSEGFEELFIVLLIMMEGRKMKWVVATGIKPGMKKTTVLPQDSGIGYSLAVKSLALVCLARWHRQEALGQCINC